MKKAKSPTQHRQASAIGEAPPAINPLLVIIVSVWALNISLVKIALKEFSPLAFNALRLTIASVILMSALYLTEKSVRIARKDVPKILFLSFSGYAVCQTLVIVGIHLTSATNVAVISGMSPILISLLSSFFKHDRISPVGWLGVALGFLGVYIVISGRAGGFHFSARTIRGDIVVFLAICLWAHYSVSARPLLKVYSPLKFSAVTISLGALFSLPFSFSSLKAIPAGAISPRSWGLLAFAGVVSLAAGLIIWFNSVKRVGNTQTAVYSNLQPVLAIVFAHILLKDTVSGGLAAGAALVLAGIYLARRGRIAVPTAPVPGQAQ